MIAISKDILTRHQSRSGAIVAAPSFPPYNYCWLRDGTFVALALELLGERIAAEAFHRFIGEVLARYGHKVETVLSILEKGESPGHDELLHTRYTLDGTEGVEPWGNFQLDGYGTWLWGLHNHTSSPDEAVRQAVMLTVRYLISTWMLPCFDPWEEYPERLHVATLGAIWGGLIAATEMAWINDDLRIEAADAAKKIRKLIVYRGVQSGVLGKWIDDATGTVDAAVLWNFLPFATFAPGSDVMLSTMTRVERDLVGDGVRRYVGDTYYGGGEWIITTCWLAMCKHMLGQTRDRDELLDWVQRTAIDGLLPEQVPGKHTDQRMYDDWVGRWGPIATPLLWSHAMYVLAVRQ